MPFGYALRKLREQAKLTQDQLAEQAGLSRAAIAKLESTKDDVQPRWDTLLRLSQALALPLDSFVDAARRAAAPPIDRLEALETRVRDLEDRQLQGAKILKKTRADVSQLRTQIQADRTPRRS